MTAHTSDSLLKFPCEFPIKAIGEGGAAFEARIVEIVRRHAPNLAGDAVTRRPSRNGNYLSVTVTILAESQAQLDAIYLEINACDGIRWAL